MNLIDLYGDPIRSREQEPLQPQPAPNPSTLPSLYSPPQSDGPLLLQSLRERLIKHYPNDHIFLIQCKGSQPEPRRGGGYTLQYLQRDSPQGYQFHFQVAFSETLSMLTVRGNYLFNNLFLRVQSWQRVMMLQRVLGNLNRELTPLKLAVNPITLELHLQHSSFIDATILDFKYKRNITNLSFRISYIIDLLMKHRGLLMYYGVGRRDGWKEGEDFSLLGQIDIAEQRMKAVEGSLRQVTHLSYDDAEKVNPGLRNLLICKGATTFTQDFLKIMKIMVPTPPNPLPPLRQLANEEYSRGDLSGLVTKQQQKFDFRVNLTVQLLSKQDLRREEVGGNGVVCSAVVSFRVTDDAHLRSHPQAAHALYEERLAMKTDRRQERHQSKVAMQKKVISRLGEARHPNLPTFFDDPRFFFQQNCLYSLWQDNASLKHFLKRQTVSMYQLLLMLQQAAKGLHFLHKQGIVHCDIKPANFIICRRFLIRIIDFGEARVLAFPATGSPGHTFPFAAPQVYLHGEITTALDVYSMGVTIYRCLFGDFMWGALLQQHRKREKEVVPRILPQRFRDAGEQRVAWTLACLSLKCTAELPEERPLMPWVITVLQECRNYLSILHYR